MFKKCNEKEKKNSIKWSGCAAQASTYQKHHEFGQKASLDQQTNVIVLRYSVKATRPRSVITQEAFTAGNRKFLTRYRIQATKSNDFLLF